MSKTYKTHPGWVKIHSPKSSKEVTEYHDHRHGVCDIEDAAGDKPFWWLRRGYCGYDISYYSYHAGFYPRPKRGKEIRKLMEGSMRAAWRKAKHDMLKLNRDDIEDYDVKTYQHRHSALWEMY